MSNTNKLPPIGEETWLIAAETLASDTGKKLICRTRFNGVGAAVVIFVVVNGIHQTEYEEFDEAAKSYNDLP